MSEIIIHISDLHVSDQKSPFGKINKNTHLVTPSENNNKDYLDLFIDKIKELKSKNISLIITGDISDRAEINEFSEAEKIITHLISELGISNEKLLIIPGDHDVHRFSIESELRSNSQNELDSEKLNNVKFRNFNTLYTKFKSDNISNDKLLFDYINFEDFSLIAVNSNFKINQIGGDGHLSTKLLDNELTKFRENNEGKEIILCTHHNLQGEYENNYFGQWDIENRKSLIPVLERNFVKCVLSGNEHTMNSKLLQGTQIILSDAGSFSVKDEPKIKPSFKVYEVKRNGKELLLNNLCYELRPNSGTSGNHYGDWIPIFPKDLKNKEISKIVLKEYRQASGELFELPSNPEDDTVAEEIPNSNQIIIKKYVNPVIEEKLYNIIKEKKLFHQGHFHWSETSRAHNWIDTAKLLEDKEDLYFIKNSIIDVIEKMNLNESTNLIIGLGYEGNIISSKTSVKYPIPYTYLPYSYRWEDHNEFENKLNFDNSGGRYKQVILITDVVNDGRTIRKLVGKENREKKFFEKVERIIVISLFYTGHKNLNTDILNYNNLEEHEKIDDEEINNIEYYTIKQLKIEKCPYGENYKEECFILKDNLHCVHKFYSEKIQLDSNSKK
jgi:orotate phosphoribosyltransferase